MPRAKDSQWSLTSASSLVVRGLCHSLSVSGSDVKLTKMQANSSSNSRCQLHEQKQAVKVIAALMPYLARNATQARSFRHPSISLRLVFQTESVNLALKDQTLFANRKPKCQKLLSLLIKTHWKLKKEIPFYMDNYCGSFLSCKMAWVAI